MAAITETQYTDLGAGHSMNTNATLEGLHVNATTETKTVTWLGGFTGGVQLIFYNANKVAIGASNEHSFGVDGTWIGRSDRTDYWGEDITLQGSGPVTGFTILQFWAPKYSAIYNIVAKAVQIGQAMDPLLQELKSAGLIP